MFRFFNGTPRLLVPDNLKSGIHKASFYDPEINRTYGALAHHYGVGVLPARPRKPRDKAKVEAAVRFAQTYILGRLRRQTFFSLAECNAAIAAAVEAMNSRPMRKLGVSRRELFEKIEREALCPLPETDWEFAEWRRARVNIDYHIEIERFPYSVPHALIHAEVDVRITARMIEIFYRGQRVALHERRYMGRQHSTDPDHMPSSHRRYADWTPDRFRRWAAKIGPNTEGLIAAVLASRRHPEQGFRTCLGILKLFAASIQREPKPSLPERWKSAPSTTRASRLSLLGSRRPQPPKTARRRLCSITPICAAPAITIEKELIMLAHPTLDQLHALGLHGVAKGFKELEHRAEARGLEHAEWLGLLLEYEVTLRRQKRFETRSRAARLRHPASVEDVDYQSPRGLDRALFLKLAACDWIAERRNLLITGASGLGKSWLACALGPESLPAGYLRALLPRAQTVHRPCRRAWRRALQPAAALDRTRQAPDPR